MPISNEGTADRKYKHIGIKFMDLEAIEARKMQRKYYIMVSKARMTAGICV